MIKKLAIAGLLTGALAAAPMAQAQAATNSSTQALLALGLIGGITALVLASDHHTHGMHQPVVYHPAYRPAPRYVPVRYTYRAPVRHDRWDNHSRWDNHGRRDVYVMNGRGY